MNTISILSTIPRKLEIKPERVKVSSREVIKPSSPTPIENKTVKFSLTDQLSPSLYSSMILFYENDIEQILSILKESLSKTLVDFYPLAGRIKGNELIECNDQGVEFIDAHYSSENLVDFIESPTLVDLKAILPTSYTTSAHNNYVMMVQLNHFPCGGVAIGVCISHKICDGSSMVDFLNSWASKTTQFLNGFKNNNKNNTIVPKFNGSSLFPPLKDLNDKIFNPQKNSSKEKIASRSLIFDKKTIDKLKADEVTKTGVIRPTTNEVIIGFIWKQLQPKFSSVLQFVNLRTKMEPVIPKETFGNFVYFTKTTLESNPNPGLAITELLRDSIAKLDHDYIQDIYFRDASLSQLKKETKDMYENRETRLLFSNVSKLGLYQVDFGMGKPVRVCLPNIGKNLVLIMPTKCGHGIEVWTGMLQDDIEILDRSFSKLGYPLVKPL